MTGTGKRAPEIRFRGFTDNWEQRKLGELLTEVKRPIKMKDDESYELVTVKRRNEGIVSRGIFKGKDVLVNSQFQIKTGDYLISKRQVVHGANGIVPNHLNNAIVSNEYLVSLGNKNITTDFLSIISRLPSMYRKFFLSSYGIDIEKLVFNVEDWKKRTIQVPGISEQNQITIFFKQLDSTIALHQRKLTLLKQLKQTYLKALFPQKDGDIPSLRFAGFSEPWEHRKLGETVQITMGQSPNGENYTENPKDHILVQGNADMKNGRVSPRVWTTQVTKKAEPDDIILSVRAPVGDVGKTDYPIVLGRGVAGIKGNAFIFQTLLRMKEIGFWTRYSSGSTFESINSGDLKEAVIQIPNVEEQAKIGSYLTMLDDTMTLHQCKIEKLIELKHLFLGKMFL